MEKGQRSKVHEIIISIIGIRKWERIMNSPAAGKFIRIPKNPPNRDQVVVILSKQGKTYREISILTNYTFRHISRILAANGLTHPVYYPPKKS